MEEIVKRVIENELVRKPSKGFTNKVMDEIFEMNASFESKPLISLRVWIGVGLVLILLTVYVMFVSPPSSGQSNSIAFKWIGEMFSSIKLPTFDFQHNINVYVIAASSLAFILLAIFDLVLFRKKYN